MRKALLLFGNESDRENLVDSAVFLQNELKFEIFPLYVKDISRDKVISTSGDGLMIGGRAPILFQGWEEIEKEDVDHIRSLLKNKGIEKELDIDIGLINDVVTDKMKMCDLLIMGKNEVFSEKTLDILKGNYKCVIFIGEKSLTKFENIVIANDDGVKVNKSCFHFMWLFPEIKSFTSLAINKELEENVLKAYIEGKDNVVKHEVIKSSNYDEILNKINNYDLFIMGNLSRNYFFEKIIGKNGIKLLEKSKAPVFIG